MARLICVFMAFVWAAPTLSVEAPAAADVNAFSEDREACIQAGMDDFLTKPVMPDTLFKVLLRWLRQKPN